MLSAAGVLQPAVVQVAVAAVACSRQLVTELFGRSGVMD